MRLISQPEGSKIIFCDVRKKNVRQHKKKFHQRHC